MNHLLKIKKEFKNSNRNELDKACFQHDTAYGDVKDLKGTAAFDEVLRDKAFNIAKNPKYVGYQRGFASMIYKIFDKKSKGGGVVNNEIKQSLQLAKELHKPIITKLEKRKCYSGFKANILVADLADMQLISTFNKGVRYLLCFIDIFSKYAWVVPLKDKKSLMLLKKY